MKLTSFGGVLAVALVLTGGVMTAAEASVEWTQQVTLAKSYDFSSQIQVPSIMADDWTCQSSAAITGIKWWGSYWSNTGSPSYYSDGLNNAGSGGIQSFTVKVWTNVPESDEVGYSHPGEVLNAYRITNFTEAAYGKVWYTQTRYEDVYQYEASLPLGIPQSAGTTYWLSIEANMPNAGTRQWGWHASGTNNLGYSVQYYQSTAWYYPCGGVDMAFELVSAPEPGSLIALTTGVFGMAAFGLRRRRRN